MTDLVDLNHLNLYVGDDTDLRDEILAIYQEQLSMWLGKFTPQMSDDEWYQANHTLKGASRGVGVWSIGDVCELAEAIKGQKAESQRAALIAELLPLGERVLGELDVLLKADAA